METRIYIQKIITMTPKKKENSFGPTISGHIANPIQSPELKKDSTLLPQSEKREISYQLSNIQPIIKENLILQTGGVSRIKLPWRVAIPTFTFQTRTTECVAIVKIGTLLFVRTIIQNRGRFVVSPENEGTCFNKPNFDGSEQIYRCVGRKKKVLCCASKKGMHGIRHTMTSRRPRITGLLIDISGNLHVDSRPTPNAVEAFQRLVDSKIPFRLCSNSSKESSLSLETKLNSMGFTRVRNDDDDGKQLIWTSLGAVAQYLKEMNLKRLRSAPL